MDIFLYERQLSLQGDQSGQLNPPAELVLAADWPLL